MDAENKKDSYNLRGARNPNVITYAQSAVRGVFILLTGGLTASYGSIQLFFSSDLTKNIDIEAIISTNRIYILGLAALMICLGLNAFAQAWNEPKEERSYKCATSAAYILWWLALGAFIYGSYNFMSAFPLK